MPAQRPYNLRQNITFYSPDCHTQTSKLSTNLMAKIYIYIFFKIFGTFYADRIAQLEYIAEEGGSLQSNDTLDYAEFLNIRKGKFNAKTIEQFKNAVERLNKKIEQFDDDAFLKSENFEAKTFKKIYLDKENENAHNKKKKTGPSLSKHKTKTGEPSLSKHKLVMECKQFMRKLMSEEGEGSWLNIYTFMDDKPVKQYKHAKKLRNIHELSKIQSAKLDEMINEAMWQEHAQNQPVRRSLDRKKRVIVEGAGPIGLFSVFHLFLAGAHVTVLNDRPERYTRNQMTFIDAKFVAQFRFFLGTKFDKLYIGEKALARINTLDGEVGQQNVKLMEQVSKERLVELASFVESKLGHGEPKRLTLLYQTALKGTDGTFEHAIIGASSKYNADQKLYTKWMVEIRAKSEGIDLDTAKRMIFDEKVKRILQLLADQPEKKKVVRNDAVIETDKNGKITVNQQAKLEMEGKTAELQPVHFTPIPFDILFCAGGTHDRIRDDLLGKPLRRSISKNYGIVVFEKGNPDENVFDNLTAFFNVKMQAFEPFLLAQNFDEFVAKQKDILPNKFVKKYRDLTQLIVRGLAHENNRHEVDHEDKGHTKPIYKTDANGHFVLADQSEDPRQIVRLFENRPTLHLASITPPAVEEFVRDIKKVRPSAKSNPEKLERINKILMQFERKWSAAIFDLCLHNAHPEKVGKITINMDADGVPGKQYSHNQLNIDPQSTNTSTFALTIFAVENAVRSINRKDQSAQSGQSAAIIAAIGDANTSPHFMTTSGLSTGRFGVEWSAYALRDYHRGQITERDLINRMSNQLNSIQRRVIKKVQEYVTIVDKEGKKDEGGSSNLDKNKDKVFKTVYRSDAGNA
uniref:Uncharacterized protein n=1 Tax=Globodera rostochiensis TaxID=31243 RepID=A0A914H6W6_GLORO